MTFLIIFPLRHDKPHVFFFFHNFSNNFACISLFTVSVPESSSASSCSLHTAATRHVYGRVQLQESSARDGSNHSAEGPHQQMRRRHLATQPNASTVSSPPGHPFPPAMEKRATLDHETRSQDTVSRPTSRCTPQGLIHSSVHICTVCSRLISTGTRPSCARCLTSLDNPVYQFMNDPSTQTLLDEVLFKRIPLRTHIPKRPGPVASWPPCEESLRTTTPDLGRISYASQNSSPVVNGEAEHNKKRSSCDECVDGCLREPRARRTGRVEGPVPGVAVGSADLCFCKLQEKLDRGARLMTQFVRFQSRATALILLRFCLARLESDRRTPSTSVLKISLRNCFGGVIQVSITDDASL